MPSRHPTPFGRRFRAEWALPICLVLASTLPAAGEEKTGEQIYRAMCVSCHGVAGEGSKEFSRELTGDRSPAQLAKLIERTMPEDEPGSCVGEEARKVATYIYN